LLEALWTHKVYRHRATKVTSFELVFGQEGVLPMEINLQTCSVARQNALLTEEYIDLVMDKLSEAPDNRFKALRKIEKEKLQTIKAYNNKVREKSFQIGDLV
jgi:hypothetical protein